MQSKRVFTAFWIFGLVNNVLYVVILSAAIDLVGPLTPKATVLIADVVPSFILKVTAPFFIHLIPYHIRIFLLLGLSFFGMLIVSSSTQIPPILFGIVLASMSSGLGETTFLQLTHFYSETALSAWSSGTGGAGLAGSFIFLVMTTWLNISPRTTLLFFAVVPFTFLIAYFKILPVSGKPPKRRLSTSISRSNSSAGLVLNGVNADDTLSREGLAENEDEIEVGLLDGQPIVINSTSLPSFNSLQAHILATVKRIKPYILPYMAPLFTVYVSEYIINQGISPVLLFPIEEMPFANYRDAYVTYGTLYQLGVFISRSSGSFIRVKRVWIPSILQMFNLVICIIQALFVIIPNIYFLFVLIFYEGLLGGLSYVNTFMLASEKTSLYEREFAMGCVGISDSAGIVLAATLAMFIEPSLCHYQVSHDRPYCTLH
ncbi:hypothetical protein CANARDRAFT_29282 [[Candida] arabinofermentans NRRL YB-2248]|uniref:Protein BTN n=1 Tax=[Candida] arabinofermentans NRRL YB-2248 TaxID=983967 RepID=A0A1E4SY52_9ASCO|nr:hypothetical protein CANARDRAFT_29282 [[Candida] arabinofermentans NRRL YB-2248]